MIAEKSAGARAKKAGYPRRAPRAGTDGHEHGRGALLR